jgi:zinc-ribbon domain
MVAVALADSDLAQAEADLIASFCRMIGIQQEQLDLVTSDVSKRLKEQAPTVPCTKCGAQIQTGARFCPSCGAAVENAVQTTTALEFDIPKTGYGVMFSESTAPGFTTAIELAKQIGPVQTIVKNKKNWYLVSISSDRFVDVTRVAKALSGIRNRAIYYDGQQMDWEEVFGFIWCANQRDHAYSPVEYCFGKDENRLNAWGCKQARMDWTEWSSWFSLGHWEQSGLLNKRHVWVFNKDRIRHDLATNLHRFRFCPYLNQKFVEAVVVSIPERVEITENGPWKYNSVYEETPGSIKVVEREGSGDFTYTREYYADGVRPRGLIPLKEIFTRAFSISQEKPDVSPQALLTK